MGGPVVKNGDRNVSNATLNGVSQEFNEVMNLDISAGRYFTPQESMSGAPIVILGSEVAAQLFAGGVNPVGKEVDVFGDKLTVIGVFAKEGKSLVNTSNDNVIMVPYFYLTSKVKIDGFQVEPAIMVRPKDGVTVDELKDEIRSVMRAARRIPPKVKDNFAMNQISIISGQITAIFGVLDVVALIIGGFAILVGGFGIANIMFVSVRERTNLIGIKKALGAKNYFILLEFLIESVILAIIGGIIGLVLVFFTVKGLSAAIDFALVLDLRNILRGLIVSSVIGLIAGFWPAWSASRLNPVDAIRFK
jgi:putative ABC transport system permease protein